MSSDKEWVFRIRDILEAIEDIDQFTNGMTFKQFEKNKMARNAVIKSFEIVGEAARGIPASVRRRYSHILWGKMIGMRNTLIHEYTGIDVHIVWHAAQVNLPVLHKQLKELLEVEG